MKRDEAMLIDEQENDCCQCGACEVYEVEQGSYFDERNRAVFKSIEVRCMGCDDVLDVYTEFDHWYGD